MFAASPSSTFGPAGIVLTGSGSTSPWLPVGTTSVSHTWVAPGTYTVSAQARCATDTQVLSAASPGLTVTVDSRRNHLYTGHSIRTGQWRGWDQLLVYDRRIDRQFRKPGPLFDRLGDGTTSGWLAQGTVTASHAWRTAGTYSVTAYAADATGLLIQSNASAGLSVAM